MFTNTNRDKKRTNPFYSSTWGSQDNKPQDINDAIYHKYIKGKIVHISKELDDCFNIIEKARCHINYISTKTRDEVMANTVRIIPGVIKKTLEHYQFTQEEIDSIRLDNLAVRYLYLAGGYKVITFSLDDEINTKYCGTIAIMFCRDLMTYRAIRSKEKDEQ